MSELTHARAAKKHLLAQLAGRPDVDGVGIARAGSIYRLKVNVQDPSAADQVPSSVDGIEVTVTVVGRIRPQG